MTGTAATEAEEFKKIYNLDVISIPTNKPIRRKDEPDLVYKTQQAKYAAVARETAKKFKEGQPVLIGTTSIEKNEIISRLLKKKGIPHQILNAKNHQKEAGIIAQAGESGAVTVATNMAGRGVDIILGGEPPKKTKDQKSKKKDYEQGYKKWQEKHKRVIELGGLHIVGTERHEARRIDNQLRGRSGRQGDPGSSQFFVALDDDLMRVFGGEQISGLMTKFNMPENLPISHSMVNKVIEQIQVKVEGFNFDIRKSLVEFDDVVARQREIVYQRRRKVLEWFGKRKRRLRKEALKVLHQEVNSLVAGAVDPETMKKDMDKVVLGLAEILALERKSDRDDITDRLRSAGSEGQLAEDKAWQLVKEQFLEREEQMGEEVSRDIERFLFIHVLDNLWVDHLTALDALRDGVRLRGYGQRDPLIEYRREGFTMFKKLLANFGYHFSRRIFRIQVAKETVEPARLVEARGEMVIPGAGPVEGSDNTQLGTNNNPASIVKPVVSGQKKIGRNDPCWCGSKKKWKKCHYPLAASR